MGLLFLFLIAGCTGEQIRGGDVAISTKNDRVAFYLLDGTNKDDFGSVLNTTYKIKVDGEYIGEYSGDIDNRTRHANFSNTTVPFIYFASHSELEVLASSESEHEGEHVYSKLIKYDMPDSPTAYYRPAFDVAQEGTFNFDAELDGVWDINRYNWTVSALPYDKIYMDVHISDQNTFKYICCNFDRRFVEGIDFREKYTRKLLSDAYPAYELTCSYYAYKLAKDMEITISTGDTSFMKEPTTVNCHFLDEEAYMDRDGDFRVGTSDDRYNDLGLPNPGFNITIS